MPEAALWDMDGTLVDTEPYWIEAEQELVAAHGGTWTHEDALGCVGQPLLTSAGLLAAAGVPWEPEKIVDHLQERVVAQVRARTPWRPGALRLLADLAAAGVPCALVTMSYRDLADPVVAATPPGSFAAVVTGEQVTRGKPHPEPYLLGAERLGVDVTACVAIEDSHVGIASALASGAATLGVEAVLPVAARPGLSRAASLEQVDLDLLARLRAGEVVDLLGS